MRHAIVSEKYENLCNYVLSHLRLVITFYMQRHVFVVEEQRDSKRLTSYCRTPTKVRGRSTVFSLLNMTEPFFPSRAGTCERKTRAFAFQPHDISTLRWTDRVLHSKKLAVIHPLAADVKKYHFPPRIRRNGMQANTLLHGIMVKTSGLNWGL